jgi:hypothetical protein
VNLAKLMTDAELMPLAAADCTAGKIDEHEEDER